MGRQITVTVGAPASGKTTWAMKRMEMLMDRGQKYVWAERDDIREKYAARKNIAPHGKEWSKRDEEKVSATQTAMIVDALKEDDMEVLITDTNLNHKTMRRWENLAKEFNAELVVVAFHTEHRTLFELNEQRKGHKRVPDKVMRDFIVKMVEQYPFPVNGSSEIKRPILLGEYDDFKEIEHSDTVIVDMDGTLAKMGNRSPYDDHRADQDTVNKPVYDTVQALSAAGYKLLIMSGRDEGRSRTVTRTWLSKNGVNYRWLLMRPEGDHMKDSVVKHDLLVKFIDQYGHVPVMALDDRDQVVRVWRDMGITCFQVADGNF